MVHVTNFNKLIPLTSDDLFERGDYGCLAERFPVPSIRRGVSPEPISELRAGVLSISEYTCSLWSGNRGVMGRIV